MQDFTDRLKLEIQKGLPGKEVQWQMAPRHRVNDLPEKQGKTTRDAAVLILLYPCNGRLTTLLMQRTEYEGIHSGQISFPGGKKEHGDEDNVHTALREAMEETGVNPSEISVLGTLTPLYIPASNMLVTPVLGWMGRRPGFNPKPDEVSFLIDADLDSLADPSIVKVKTIEVRGRIIEALYFDYNGHFIWGATAMMLNELLALLRNAGVISQADLKE